MTDLSNKIIQSDCVEFMKTMADSSVDISITSPPYNVGDNQMTEPKYGENYQDNMTGDEYAVWIEKVIREMVRVTKYYVFFNIQMLSANKIALLQVLGNTKYIFKEVMIWTKKNSPPPIEPGIMTSSFEFIFVFSKFNPQKRKFDRAFFEQGRFKNVIDGKNASQNEYSDVHKATFPLYLPGLLINAFSDKGDLVFDPFCGTSTTCVAAQNLGRNYLGLDISEQYCNISRERLRQKTLI